MSPDLLNYLDFLQDIQLTASGRTYSQILNYSNNQLESDHQFIQWLFPLSEASAFVTGVPIIDPIELFNYVQTHSWVQEYQLKSYQLMMNHIGLEYINHGIRIKEASRLRLLNGHNALRFSRILQSLVYHDLASLARETLSFVLDQCDRRDDLHPAMDTDRSTLTIWEIYFQKALIATSDAS